MTDDRTGMVAVVDDDEGILDSLRVLIEMTGCMVSTYASAAAYLADRARLPTCLILDQNMPQTTGLQLASDLRDRGVLIPILLITATPSPEILARAAKLGIEKVLEKPLDEGELLGFVAAHT
jgi:FixJ family two-component response regulator